MNFRKLTASLQLPKLLRLRHCATKSSLSTPYTIDSCVFPSITLINIDINLCVFLCLQFSCTFHPFGELFLAVHCSSHLVLRAPMGIEPMLNTHPLTTQPQPRPEGRAKPPLTLHSRIPSTSLTH